MGPAIGPDPSCRHRCCCCWWWWLNYTQTRPHVIQDETAEASRFRSPTWTLSVHKETTQDAVVFLTLHWALLLGHQPFLWQNWTNQRILTLRSINGAVVYIFMVWITGTLWRSKGEQKRKERGEKKREGKGKREKKRNGQEQKRKERVFFLVR